MFSPSQWGQTSQSSYGEAGNKFDPQFYVIQSPMQTQPQQPTWNPTFNITIPGQAQPVYGGTSGQPQQPSALAGLPPPTPRPQGTVPTAPAFTATPTPRPSGTMPTPAPTVMDLPQSAFVQSAPIVSPGISMGGSRPGDAQVSTGYGSKSGTVTPSSGNGPDYVRQAMDYARALRSNAGVRF